MRRVLDLLALALWLGVPLVGQPSFVEVSPPTDPYFITPATEDFWVTAVAPADVDGDGDLDLGILGFYVEYHVSAEDRLVLMLNDGPGADGNWQFSHQLLDLGPVSAGASDLAWGDFDADGDQDLAVASDGLTVLYRNDGGAWTVLANELPGYYEDSAYTGAYDLRSVTWADFDNDGDLDLLVPSVFDFDLFEYRTALVRNDGADGAGGWLFTEVPSALGSTVHAQSGWADDDGDGDLDLLLVNVDPYTETGFVRRYGNDAGSFTGSDLLGIAIEYGLADWGDYDADGDLDLLVAGNIQETAGSYNTVLRIYRNDAGTYTETTLIDAPNVDWLDIHAATWADYDSDGDVDLLVTGNYIGADEIEGKSEVYGNEAGTYSALGLALPAPISSVGRGGAFTWLDIDGDGDLDYFVAGAYYVPGGNGLVEANMHLYRNDVTAANAGPTAPTGLSAAVAGSGAVLAWEPALDDHTPASALTYDLILHRAGSPVSSARRLPEPGNLSAVTDWSLFGLEPGSYTWSVRAVDSAFEGGAQAQGSFEIPAADLIFRDGFESGSLGMWSSATP